MVVAATSLVVPPPTPTPSPVPTPVLLPWGDVNCSAAVDAVDALNTLRFAAGLPVTKPDGCPQIGQNVEVR